MNIIIKKINNQYIFYDKDIEINIEELFLNGNFATVVAHEFGFESCTNLDWDGTNTGLDINYDN